MEREENLNGTGVVASNEASHSVETAMRQMKNAEPFVLNESREDNPQDGGYRGLEDEAMAETKRDDLPEVNKADPEFVEEHPTEQTEEVKPEYRVTDNGEETVIVPKEVL